MDGPGGHTAKERDNTLGPLPDFMAHESWAITMRAAVNLINGACASWMTHSSLNCDRAKPAPFTGFVVGMMKSRNQDDPFKLLTRW